MAGVELRDHGVAAVEDPRGPAPLAGRGLQNTKLAISSFFKQARSRLYRNRLLQLNIRFSACFKLYTICTLLHQIKLNILAQKLLEIQYLS